jgi:hypothetical protein
MGTAQAGRVQLVPSSQARDELTERWGYEASIVMNSVYPRPFWRETPFLADIPVMAGGTSLVASPVGEGMERYFDVSRTEEGSGCPGVLRTHIPKDEAAARVALRRFRMQDKLDSLIAWVGRTPPPDMYVEQAWNVSARYTLPSVMTTYGASFREPVGAVHWAGAELSPLFMGTMEGALRSGQRVAQQVLASLVKARVDGKNGMNTDQQSGTSPDATRENTASPTPFRTAVQFEDYKSMWWSAMWAQRLLVLPVAVVILVGLLLLLGFGVCTARCRCCTCWRIWRRECCAPSRYSGKETAALQVVLLVLVLMAALLLPLGIWADGRWRRYYTLLSHCCHTILHRCSTVFTLQVAGRGGGGCGRPEYYC